MLNRGTVLVSGQRGINTNTTLDGMDYDNGFFGGTFGSAEGRAPLSVSQESIKEFTVIRNGASVEFGPSGGGAINLITKSGTNDFHGSGFYYDEPHATTAHLANGIEAPDQKKQRTPLLGGKCRGFLRMREEDRSSEEEQFPSRSIRPLEDFPGAAAGHRAPAHEILRGARVSYDNHPEIVPNMSFCR